ncbi:MAG: hypothetical protein M3Y27_14020, partial [Acidobacteriota bacterium]|nr:hypothetical protein [Acidobacteriota bacterium]
MKFGKVEHIALAFTVVGSLLISWAAALNAQTKPSVELEAAMTKEQVNGDLRASIAAYQKIADDAVASREVRAKALLHLASCYERLGQDAQRVYQQIVRDFADQPAAAQSRGRLAALQQVNRASTPATMTQRKIDIPWDTSFGPIDTDGRRVVYRSKTTKDLIYADLLTGTKRVVFKTPPIETPAFWQPSRDFSMVHIMFRTKPNRLAVIKTDGTGYRELIRDDAQGSVLGDGWDARWSWDNRYLLVVSRASNRLMAVDIVDGARRELVTLKSGRLGGGNFSPDGRFVAYDVEPALPPAKGSVSQIFVLPVQGGEPLLLHEEPASESFRELDWTADGRYLAIASMRTGKAALHLLPVKDGQAAGAPLFVRYGNIDEGYTTKGGAFIYSTVKPGGSVAGHVASLDSNGRPSNWQRLAFRGDNLQDPNPDWAPDATQIVYSTSDD